MKDQYTCAQCGKIFSAFPSYGHHVFCSNHCRYESYKLTPEKFWSHVDCSGGESACWIWQMSTDSGGYGQVSIDGRMVLVHRHAYEITVGLIPDEMELAHSCDTRLCCNFRHLIPMTHVENMKDAANKHRMPARRGSDNNKAKLTWEQVRDIRVRYAMGAFSQRKLAREFGVNQYAIWAIVTGKHWIE